MKYLFFLISASLLLGCFSREKPETLRIEKENLQAISELQPLGTSQARGIITFEQQDDDVRIFGSISGLEPDSKHAFHIHDVGDCGNNGENAGEHFNPLKAPHGKFGDLPHHAGDFPQLEADEDGRASVDFTAETISLSEPKFNVLGRALIVHAGEDKYTQPSGDAGARIACGVIEKKR